MPEEIEKLTDEEQDSLKWRASDRKFDDFLNYYPEIGCKLEKHNPEIYYMIKQLEEKTKEVENIEKILESLIRGL